jgi:Cytochrome c554 and c-prime
LLLRKIKIYHIVIIIIVSVIYLGTTMCDSMNNGKLLTEIKHPNGKAFAGSETCKNCHRDIFESHLHTSHYLTSGPATPSRVLGSFDDGRNIFYLNNFLKVGMFKTSEKMIQVGYVEDREVLRKPIDIVIGSGRKGQTYLYWQDNRLFQLPVSYYTPSKNWCGSPGYPDNQIMFNRAISIRCLECHGTYFKSVKIEGREEYDKNQMIFAVDCERCHGPAADHVKFQSENPDIKQARYIINPALLSRQQKLDNCALCHSGLRENKKPSFSFLVGDTLENYSHPDYNVDSSAGLDVHGNQYGLLISSKCFRMSSVMDCSSCHNTHVNENNVKVFSMKCLVCHQPSGNSYCRLKDTTGIHLVDNCIDCHMPALPSQKILMQVNNRSSVTHDLVRTHLIGIYWNETKKFQMKRIPSIK